MKPGDIVWIDKRGRIRKLTKRQVAKGRLPVGVVSIMPVGECLYHPGSGGDFAFAVKDLPEDAFGKVVVVGDKDEQGRHRVVVRGR